MLRHGVHLVDQTAHLGGLKGSVVEHMLGYTAEGTQVLKHACRAELPHPGSIHGIGDGVVGTIDTILNEGIEAGFLVRLVVCTQLEDIVDHLCIDGCVGPGSGYPALGEAQCLLHVLGQTREGKPGAACLGAECGIAGKGIEARLELAGIHRVSAQVGQILLGNIQRGVFFGTSLNDEAEMEQAAVRIAVSQQVVATHERSLLHLTAKVNKHRLHLGHRHRKHRIHKGACLVAVSLDGRDMGLVYLLGRSVDTLPLEDASVALGKVAAGAVGHGLLAQGVQSLQLAYGI